MIGNKGARLLCRRSAQSEERHILGHKAIRKFRRHRVIARLAAVAQIENDRVHFFPGKSTERSVEFLQLRPAQISRAQIADVAIQDLTVERSRRGTGGAAGGQESDAATKSVEQALEGGAIQLDRAQGFWIDVVLLDQADGLFEIGRIESINPGLRPRRGRRGGGGRGRRTRTRGRLRQSRSRDEKKNR